MAYWLVKSDPDSYGLDDLERDLHTTWDGVTNPLALKHLRAIARGDQILVYHTGGQKAVVGVGQARSDARADPRANEPKLAVFDLAFVRRLPKPVPLAAIKADPSFADFALVRQGRLSVMPVTPMQWKCLLGMAGER